MVAALIIIVWGVTGPIFKFSDTWQAVITRWGYHSHGYAPSSIAGVVVIVLVALLLTGWL